MVLPVIASNDIQQQRQICRLAQIAAVATILVVNSLALSILVLSPAFGALLIPLDILVTVLAYDVFVSAGNHIKRLDNPALEFKEQLKSFFGHDDTFKGTLLLRHIAPIVTEKLS